MKIFGTVKTVLFEQNFDGNYSYEDIMKEGDFGLGTFNGLDGEMIAYDGDFYHITSSCVAVKVKKSQLAPAAIVTRFSGNIFSGDIAKPVLSLEDLFMCLDNMIDEAGDKYFAARIEGEFSKVLVRSPVKLQKPYPAFSLNPADTTQEHYKRLDKIIHHKAKTIENAEGVMVGFYNSSNINRDVGFPGWHFHFITKKKEKNPLAGGHVLDCAIKAFAVKARLLQLNEPQIF